MKAAGYIRVSSEMQAEQGHSLETQRTLIVQYAQAQGWTLVTMFSDAGLSGASSSRPGLQTLLERAAQGEFEVIIVYALDRFYRNLPRLLVTLEQLRKQHVGFVSVTEHLDFTTPWGKLELAVLGSLAEIYVDKLRAETSKGKQARARKGLWNGSIPFGYCNGRCSACTDVNGKDYCPDFGQANRGAGKALIAHPIESHGVKLIYEWYGSGECSDRDIARKLNGYSITLSTGATRHFRTKRGFSRGGPQSFTRDGVREILTRLMYTGMVPYYGRNERGRKLKRGNYASLALGTQPALIAHELFERCQQVRKKLAAKFR